MAIRVIGDKEGWPYRSGSELVRLFNELGFRDTYGPGFPSRKVFAVEKIQALNGTDKLKTLIRVIFEERRWELDDLISIDDAVDDFNKTLKPVNYQVVKDSSEYKVKSLSGDIIDIENRFEDSDELNELMIEEQIQKCREKIDSGDYSGAITNARTLLENVCIKIETELSTTPQKNDGNLNKLFNRTRDLLNLDPSRKDITDSLKQVLTGLVSITSGLAGLRNKMSDSHAAEYQPQKHHAKLAVNAAKTLSDFLLDTMNYQVKKGIIKPVK